MWPVAEDIVRSPDVSALEVRIARRPSVSGRLPRALRGRHHQDRHGCPPAQRGDALDPWRLTAGPRRP